MRKLAVGVLFCALGLNQCQTVNEWLPAMEWLGLNNAATTDEPVQKQTVTVQERIPGNSDTPITEDSKKERKAGIIQVAGKAWERCSVGQSEVYCTGQTRSLNWWQARDYCKALQIKGHKWRLPKSAELRQLHTWLTSNPNHQFFLNKGAYWSDEAYNDSNKASATVFLTTGDAYGELQWNNAYVKCIAD